MTKNEYNIRSSSILKEIDKIDELIKKLKDPFNNEYLDNKAKTETEKYLCQRNNLLLELNEINNKYKVTEKINYIKAKEAYNEAFNKLNIDPNLYEHILENVILSDEYTIEFNDDYIIIKDSRMLVKMPEVMNMDASSINKIRKRLGWNINFSSGHPYDFVEKYGKIWLRKNGWIFINKLERLGDYGKINISCFK